MSRPEVVATAPPAGVAPTCETDPDILAAYTQDASGVAPGRAAGLIRPRQRDEAAIFLRALDPSFKVLCQAARSSLTAGAVPAGEVVINVERLDHFGPVERGAGNARVRVGAGLRLDRLQDRLAAEGLYFPPVPTYKQAMIGGAVSTNAGGAATFKYGVTRDWVHGLTVLLHDGDRLELERGQCVVPRGGNFTVRTSAGRRVAVPTPLHELPALKKISAGYYSSDPLDLVDLFVGAEGTLGLVTDVTLDLVRLPPTVLTAVIFCSDLAVALRSTAALRAAAERARRDADPQGPDVRAIELLDGHCLELLRRRGFDRRHRLELPTAAGAALLLELECARRLDDGQVEERLAAWFEGNRADDGPLPRLLRILEAEGVCDTLELAFPSDAGRRETLAAFREEAPAAVAEILAQRKRDQPGIRKIAGDMIVPFAHLAEIVEVYRAELEGRDLQYAIWGHVSDGNLHPNVLAADEREVARGLEALRAIADKVMLHGGAPLSEHGVGRDPLKQELLRRFVGDGGITAMRAVRRALDPAGRLAPGTLFPAEG